MSRAMGNLGEQAACKYLEAKGYKVIDRNWYCRYGELDIVCEKNKNIIFVEVKTRSKNRIGVFGDYVNKSKLKKLRYSIDEYLYSKRFSNVSWRLDGILLIKEQGHFRFHHFQGLIE